MPQIVANIAMTTMTNATFVRRNMIASYTKSSGVSTSEAAPAAIIQTLGFSSADEPLKPLSFAKTLAECEINHIAGAISPPCCYKS